MKKKIIFALLFVFYSCNSEETVQLIFKELNGKEYSLIVPAEIDDITIEPYKKNIYSIKNIEKLKKLKRLRISMITSLKNLTFLNDFKTLEILQISGHMKDLTFLKYLKNLKYISIMETVYQKGIDFKNNIKLEYLKLRGVTIKDQNHQFNLELKNIPKSLKYLNLQYTQTEKFSIAFLETIKDIPCVLIDKELYLQYKEYFDQHPNFTYEAAEKVLPPELIDENLFFKHSEYEFF